MINKISPRDWETLSAFLDEQLTTKERAQLVARLEANPDLSEALENLRRTRAMLRRVPRLRAPRNFTLTSEMAGARPGTRSLPEIYPVLRLASVLATFFFLVIFVGSLIGRNVTPQSVSMAPAQQQPIRPPMGLGGGGGGGGEGGAPAPGMEAPMEAIAPESEAAAQGEEATKAFEASPAADSLKALVVTPLSSPSATFESTPTPMPEVARNAEAAPQLGVTPAEEAQTPPSASAGSWSILLLVQILLAIVAVGTGVGTLYLRRLAQK